MEDVEEIVGGEESRRSPGEDDAEEGENAFEDEFSESSGHAALPAADSPMQRMTRSSTEMSSGRTWPTISPDRMMRMR